MPLLPRRRTDGRADDALWDTQRLEAFSDGVLAIAITLLIIEIKPPHHEPDALGAALAGLWPSYLAYATSFLLIGIMWTQHHGLFKVIRRADQGLLLVNVLLLAAVSFVPFPTAVVAETLGGHSGRRDVTAALLLYGGTFVAVALLFNLLWHYARLRGLLDPGLDARAVRTTTRRYVAGPLLYAAAMAVAPFSTVAAYAVWIGLALSFVATVPQPAADPPP